MSADDDKFDDAERDAAMEEFERHSDAIQQLVQDYIDEHDLIEEMASAMLMDMSIRLRMIGYALDTEKPSTAGLKLDLDRFQRMMDDGVRAAKKDAEHFITEMKAAREQIENEDDEESDDKGRAPS